MLSVSGLEGGYARARVLQGVDLEVGEGEAVGLLGRNGVGKTTTVRTIMGMNPPAAGRVSFAGRDITGLRPHRIARAGVALVPEGRQIFPNLTVHENLVAAARPGPWTLARVVELFPSLEARRGHWGHALSGGEQQMLAIGRALMTNPRLLILDEATEGLAPAVRADIWRCLELLRSEGLALLVIDSGMDALLRLCARHVVIEKGRSVWQGTSEALAGAPEVRRRYLGV